MTEHERAVQKAAKEVSGTAWKPVREALKAAAGVRSAGVAGVQDSSVVNRPFGSPGMQKNHDVHGLVVSQAKSGRASADLETVVERVRKAIRHEPYISSAVVIPFATDFVPSHILSSNKEVGEALAKAFPSAATELDLVKESRYPIGPWQISPKEVLRGDNNSVTIYVDVAAEDLRFLHPGDAVVLVEGPDNDTVIGIGRLHHYTFSGDSHCCLALDRFAELKAAEVVNEQVKPNADDSPETNEVGG